jgi:hypothetical protein
MALMPSVEWACCLGSEQELFPVARRLYQPKTATVDLIMRPPLPARRICLPIAAQKICGN